MSNPQLESIADQRRAAALLRLRTDRERVQRQLAMGVIRYDGTARPESQTSELRKVADEIDAKAARLRALTGDELIAEFAPND